MITPLLQNALDPVVRRHRRLRGLFAAAIVLGLAAGLAAILIAIGSPKLFVGGVAFLFITIAGLLAESRVQRWAPDYRAIAARIESRHPELHALLRTAVEQRPDPATRKLSYLQQRVVAEAVEATRRHQWLDSVPRRHWAAGYGAALAALTGLLGTFAFLEVKPRSSRVVSLPPATTDAVTVTPGDTEVERGAGLVVLAQFHRDVPSEAVLVIQPKNRPAQRLPLVKNLGDPVFGGGLPAVEDDLSYRIEHAGKATRDFSVTVFEHPKLERADAQLIFPEYTRLPEKKIPDTHRVSAVEGAKLSIDFNLNKAVKTATLVAKDGTRLPLAVAPGEAQAALRDFPVRSSQTYELQLVDADGRTNKVPAQFFIEALPNRRPELKVATPKGDSRVSPLEEVAFRAEAWDDFGLGRYGLSYTVGAGGEQHIELGRETTADEKRALSHLLKLEEAGVKPDDLVSWYLWAEDVGPDGQPRRTATDMYFAEVRPLEEIYRQGDDQESNAPPGQGDETQKLAELQKQVVSATWNLQRAEDTAAAAQPTPRYLKDQPVIRDSQAEVLRQATAMEQKIEDPKSRALAGKAVEEMKAAVTRLEEANGQPVALPRALDKERAAYNALLKLAAHQFNISRSRSQSGRESRSQSQREQLDELELKEERKRYETKREAAPQQNEEQREQLAILNRLKELAQRQQDINERLKELQTALQGAKTEQEKEEVQRQLKRLREEEQQLLADLDEARQKMEQSPQQGQLAQERRQLEQTRGEAQKAAEALEKGEPSQALASGTRAQRQLEQMREEFRKKTSNQFREEMRDMRADARELADRQQQLAEQLGREAEKPQRQTLDASSAKEQLAAQITEQQQRLGTLTESMKRVSEQAEAAEPLLARELYDALRKTAQAGTADTLEKTQQLAERGYQPQAQKFEEKARQEIEELKGGVERAAESVLGDETEALRQARAELDALAQELSAEIARARPDLAQNSSEAAGAPTGPPTDAPPSQDGPPSAGERKEPAASGKSSTSSGEAQRNPRGEHEAATQSEIAKAPRSQAPADQAPPNPGQRAGAPGSGEQPGQTAQIKPSGENDQPAPGDGSSTGGESGQQTAQGQQTRPGSASERKPGQPQLSQQNPAGQNQGTGPGDAPTGSREGTPGPRPGARLAELSRHRERTGGEGGGGIWGGPAEGEQAGPLTGERYVEWQDRLRNVEEMLDAPELRIEAARVRELAKGVRAEFKRHSVTPNWEIVESRIRAPLTELRNRVTEELARRDSKENIVPIDRDPVPTKYAERVRRYYEDLGRAR